MQQQAGTSHPAANRTQRDTERLGHNCAAPPVKIIKRNCFPVVLRQFRDSPVQPLGAMIVVRRTGGHIVRQLPCVVLPSAVMIDTRATRNLKQPPPHLTGLPESVKFRECLQEYFLHYILAVMQIFRMRQTDAEHRRRMVANKRLSRRPKFNRAAIGRLRLSLGLTQSSAPFK
jgi:hypothetical protein